MEIEVEEVQKKLGDEQLKGRRRSKLDLGIYILREQQQTGGSGEFWWMPYVQWRRLIM